MAKFCPVALGLVLSLCVNTGHAKEILTNATTMTNAPDWLTATRVEKVTDHILNKLEWTIHRVSVRWYYTDADFQQAHSMGPYIMAVTISKGDEIVVHLGPKVNQSNFDQTFGHELVHVIVGQKYKSSIPKWFEEGLANHYSSADKVNYKMLSSQPLPADVRLLAHPVRGSQIEIDYRYKASQAIAEMLDKKCDLENLIRISVERKMEDYIKTYCEINDLNLAFRDWVKKKASEAYK